MELTVTTTPAVIDANFDALEAHLRSELEKYDVVVTEDTVKEAKKQAAELNKLKAAINTRKKEAIDKISAPIEQFKERTKGLVELCDQTRTKITEQVAKFESAQLDIARAQLIECRNDLYARHKIRDEFQSAEIESQVKLTSLTGKGKLTAGTIKAVESAVNECMLLQQRTDLRLSQLENECHRAGLHSPLTREHIEGFLFADDERYRGALDRVIARELERQKETEDKLAQQQEANKTPEPAEEPEEPIEYPVTAQEKQPAQSSAPVSHTKPRTGMEEVNITVSLKITVPAELGDVAIGESLRQKLATAGIKDSIQFIQVERSITKAA